MNYSNELVSKLPLIPLNQYLEIEKSINLNGISVFGQKHE